MKYNYEVRTLTYRYGILSVLFVILLTMVTWFGSLGRIGLTMAVFCVSSLFAALAFLLSYFFWKKSMTDMENLADIMEKASEKQQDLPDEIYREGTLGRVYCNLYKMMGTLKENEAKILDEKKFLQDIIADISHQLKTPLSSLRVFTDLFYDDKIEGKEKRKQILEEAQNQLDRMEWLVLAMLKLARIEAGAVQFDLEEVRMEEVCHAVRESLSPLLKSRCQSIKITGMEGMLLKCDREWLTEALINLVKNASDYSDRNREITLEAEENPLFTRIYVKDLGMGIPEEALPHIFERFYRINHEVNPNSVGIGLPLAKSIVEGMGGRITVRSRVGEYTWMILTFTKV